ncbi:MAG TPA: 2OG-Fe(II) oxygenase [Azospirillaceae bacterium]|nr:2OG-Fe(II) oxygenase [Azospirillaceae bacterium]
MTSMPARAADAASPSAGASTIDLDAFRATPLASDPFDHLIVPGFVRAEVREAVHRDFPAISKPGSFPVRELSFGPVFRRLLEDIQGPEMTAAFQEKFGMDLTGRPTMVTVRGNARAADGQVHTDSRTKLITVLIYMNPSWESPDGRLRLLRSPDGLDQPVVEVPPHEGTLLAFRNGPTAWHGHTSVQGPRRAIQLNWVTGQDVVRREQFRHSLSARIKRLNPFA